MSEKRKKLEAAEEVQQPKARSKARLVLRLLRLGALVGIGVVVAKKIKSRSSPSGPPEGLWREGLSGNGDASGKRT